MSSPLRRRLAGSAFAALLLTGCVVQTHLASECDAGASMSCRCADEREGLALCDDDARWGPCFCGAAVPDTGLDVGNDPRDVGRDTDARPAAGSGDGDAPDGGRDGDAACTPFLVFVDGDGDGYGDENIEGVLACERVAGMATATNDCDDDDRAVHPGAPEFCDGRDNDCDGVVDEDVRDIAQWPDRDGDGYGDDTLPPISDCAPIDGRSADGGDCDDDDRDVHPGAVDDCDGVDDDCDGAVDEDAPFEDLYPDGDDDGYGDDDGVPVAACAASPGLVADDRDCDDTSREVHPGAAELCNLIDDDCDGDIDEETERFGTWPDRDGDGYGDRSALEVDSCMLRDGYAANDLDCDDGAPWVNPDGSERCNARDDDCDGVVDESPVDPRTFYGDGDGDGFGDGAGSTVHGCTAPPGFSAAATDCDDTDPDISPLATEVCDGVDEDCDGVIDNGVSNRCGGCGPEPDEVCGNLVDDDCDGAIDEAAGCFCDGRTTPVCYPGPPATVGVGVCRAGTLACVCPGGAPTCDDGSWGDCLDVVLPTEDVCDGLDNDCDGRVDEASTFFDVFEDGDGDGFGDRDADPSSVCAVPDGFADNDLDCDDTREAVSPDGLEVCNRRDDDCDGRIDEATSLRSYWPDADGDGFGDRFAGSIEACERPAATSPDPVDCDDTRADVHPGADERCNGRDDDCDELIDDDPIDPIRFFPDADGDGYGVTTGPITACTAPAHYTHLPGDCDDRLAEVNPAAVEVCNGRDDTCDFRVDEGVSNRCGTCGPEPDEVCDNLVDDDCDGAIDEPDAGCFCDGRTGQPCYTGSPATLGIGVCRGGAMDCACPGGARSCGDGAWGRCTGETLPSAEICDGLDNDCDGRVDEGVRNACGVCGPDAAELCDGLDNDCDGEIDEFARLPCGACADAVPDEETCDDGFDNDCDGVVDEDCRCEGATASCYPGPPETLGVGPCRAGAIDCYASSGDVGPCVGAVLPSFETCDGVDNDCDGEVDEWGDGCSVCASDEELCDDVDNDCDGFVDEGLRNGCGDCLSEVTQEETAGPAACNGVDDDCDGFVDEGLVNACGLCDAACYTDAWTTDDAFVASGTGDGISPSGGLRLDTSAIRFSDLWVANAADDTVTRIDTDDGTVLGTYAVGLNPGLGDDAPSRTAVDLNGDAWIASRAFGLQGSVTKIRGGDCRTDCALFTVAVGGVGGVPRALAIDANNDAWVGNYAEHRIYHLDGETGAVLRSFDVGMPLYGFAIDGEGVLWIATVSQAHGLGAFDTHTLTLLGNWPVPGCGVPYGIGVDGAGNVWFGTWSCGTLGRLDRAAFDAGAVRFDVFDAGLSYTRGVAVDATGTVWLASSGNDRLARFDATGTLLGTSLTCRDPIGVGVATDGDVWSMCNGDDLAQRWTSGGALRAEVGVGDAPYSYSDMTGFQLRAFTAPSGTWTQAMDCGFDGCGFESVSWTAIVPVDTTLTVRARSRTAGGAWSDWTPAHTTSPADTSSLPVGREIEIAVVMTTTADEVTPVVTSLEVAWQRP